MKKVRIAQEHKVVGIKQRQKQEMMASTDVYEEFQDEWPY